MRKFCVRSRILARHHAVPGILDRDFEPSGLEQMQAAQDDRKRLRIRPISPTSRRTGLRRPDLASTRICQDALFVRRKIRVNDGVSEGIGGAPERFGGPLGAGTWSPAKDRTWCFCSDEDPQPPHLLLLAPASCLNISHPAVYPIGLPEFFINLMTREGDMVVGPFLGSGSTALAALNLGRRFLGIERNAEYVRLAETKIASGRPAGPRPQTVNPEEGGR